MKPLDVRQRAREKGRGEEWFNRLSTDDKWRLGDVLVLNTFEWIDWFDAKPSDWFMAGVEVARLRWEMSGA